VLTEEQGSLFKGKNLGVVATIRADGSPQVTPVWVDWDGTHVLFNTAVNRAKAKNILRNPVVTVAVTNRDRPAQYVSVTGTAELREEGALEHIQVLSRRYRGREYTFPDDAKRVQVRVRPERVEFAGF
jgi:PPOX class probable F420-dependent enzyme